MSPPKYPLLLDLNQRRCVVVGAGKIAAGKVESLLECGARVVVIAPRLHATLRTRLEEGRLEWLERGFQAGDLAEAFLVIAATDDPEVNGRVWAEAEERGLLINAVDDPPRCNFYVPAVVRRGALTVAVSTDGKSCALAARLRRELEERFGEEYGPLLELLGELRERMKREVADAGLRRRVAFRLVEADLAPVVALQGPQQARSCALDLLAAEGLSA